MKISVSFLLFTPLVYCGSGGAAPIGSEKVSGIFQVTFPADDGPSTSRDAENNGLSSEIAEFGKPTETLVPAPTRGRRAVEMGRRRTCGPSRGGGVGEVAGRGYDRAGLWRGFISCRRHE